jgi:hypothetical protein
MASSFVRNTDSTPGPSKTFQALRYGLISISVIAVSGCRRPFSDDDPRCTRTVLGLADTFNNESVIDRPVFAVLGDALVGLAVIPILCGFHVREFRNDDSLNRITFKDFELSIGYKQFDRMTLRRCLDSSPIFFEFFLIDSFISREYNVRRNDRSPSLLIDYRYATSCAFARPRGGGFGSGGVGVMGFWIVWHRARDSITTGRDSSITSSPRHLPFGDQTDALPLTIGEFNGITASIKYGYLRPSHAPPRTSRRGNRATR